MKSIIITEYGKEKFNTDDFIYRYRTFSEYLEILQWLKDNNIWYHNVFRENSVATYELLYMSNEDVIAFKLRWV